MGNKTTRERKPTYLEVRCRRSRNKSIIKTNVDNVYETNTDVKVARYKRDYYAWGKKYEYKFRNKLELINFMDEKELEAKEEENG